MVSPENPLPPSRLQRLAEFLGLRRSIVGLLGMAILVGMGEHMAEQFLPLYLLALGGGYLSVGFLNGMDNLLGALYSFPGGYLSDRLGAKRALLIFNLISIAGFVVVVLVPSWPAVLAAAGLFLSWTAISLPATMSLVARVLPKNKRTMGVSVHSLVRRVPMALGPLAGGALIAAWGVELGVRLAFVGALVMAVVAAVLQQLLIEDDPPRDSQAPGAERNPLRLWRLMDGDLRNLLISDILVRFCEQIPYAFVVVWAVGTEQAPGPVTAVQFGLLRSVEMATAILIYVPVACLADRTRKKPFVVMTFVFFTLFPLALYFSRSFGMLLAVFVLRGLKEFGEPTRKALIMDLAPEDRKAGVFGLYYLVRDVVVSGAAFGGAFLWQKSPALNLMTACACGAVGTAWFAFRGKDLGPERRESVG
ncbi:MAG: MFS transporter [Lentisphaerae bacterium RIFOXYA12_64_32]|nr:MAG: MFS transporter [Lentisphaerae bacterium RIFOXYA12_64_32]